MKGKFYNLEDEEEKVFNVKTQSEFNRLRDNYTEMLEQLEYQEELHLHTLTYSHVHQDASNYRYIIRLLFDMYQEYAPSNSFKQLFDY